MSAPGRSQAFIAERAAIALRPVRWPEVNKGHCTGCGRCVAVCEPRLLSLEAEHWRKSCVLHASELCTGCSACAAVCPFRAIVMRRQPGAGPAG